MPPCRQSCVNEKLEREADDFSLPSATCAWFDFQQLLHHLLVLPLLQLFAIPDNLDRVIGGLDGGHEGFRPPARFLAHHSCGFAE